MRRPFQCADGAAFRPCHLRLARLSLDRACRILERVDNLPNQLSRRGLVEALRCNKYGGKPSPARVRADGVRSTWRTFSTTYLPLVIFIGVALVIGLALLVAPFVVAYKNPDPEKLSAYECGFVPFDDARMKFDIRFYLVAILFIIFDLEVAFLFPVDGGLSTMSAGSASGR